MFCERCGAQMIDGSKFCGSCGAKNEPTSQDTPPAATSYSAPAPVSSASSSGSTGYSAPPPPPPPSYTAPQTTGYSPAAAPPYAPAQPLQSNTAPLRIGQYIGMMFLMGIPIVNIILIFVWGFGKEVNLNKKNYARAMLILFAIGIVISIIFSSVIAAIFSSVLSDMFY